jgi:hypothetical protein
MPRAMVMANGPENATALAVICFMELAPSGGDSPPMIKRFGGAVTLPGVSVEGIPAY